MAVKVLKWEAVIGKVIHIPVHDEEKICLVGRQPGQLFADQYCIWMTDHLVDDTKRHETKWDRQFIALGTGEFTPENYEWVYSWQDGYNAWHLYEYKPEAQS
jgi:hypothetical protein